MADVDKVYYDPNKAKKGGLRTGVQRKPVSKAKIARGIAAFDLGQAGLRAGMGVADLPDATVAKEGGALASLAKRTVENSALLPDVTVPAAASLGGFAAGFLADDEATGVPYGGLGDRFARAQKAAADAYGQAQNEQNQRLGIRGNQEAIGINASSVEGLPIRDGQVVASVPGGEISAPFDQFQSLRQQLGTVGQGKGAVSYLPGQAVASMAVGDENRQALNEAVKAAIARGEDVSAIIGGQNADPIQSRIDEIRKKLAQPGRGLRQSLGSLLEERRNRSALEKELNSLLNQQAEQSKAALKLTGQARAQANADRNYQLNLARFGLEQQRMMTDQQRQARQRYEEQAQQLFPEDPERQLLYVAKNEAAKNPQKFFTTPDGIAARRIAKQRLIEGIKSERGLWDWFKTVFFGGREPTQSDLENLSFSDVIEGKGESILPEWISPNDVFALGPNAYVYKDNLDPETVWVIEQLSRLDKNGKTKSVRRGQ